MCGVHRFVFLDQSYSLEIQLNPIINVVLQCPGLGCNLYLLHLRLDSTANVAQERNWNLIVSTYFIRMFCVQWNLVAERK